MRGFSKYSNRLSVTNRQPRQHKHSDVAAAEEEAVASQFEFLREDVAELKLAVATMMNLLIKQGNLSTHDLQEAGRSLDALDGAIDGKLHARVLADGTLLAEKKAPLSELDQLTDAALS